MRSKTHRGDAVCTYSRARSTPLVSILMLRPNPIGLSQCRILAIEGTAIMVDRLDAWSETPILDISSPTNETCLSSV